ncbi:MAG: peptidase MA family metallohydrolase [bacterium]|nr:peptidase MA family metallohydrolase [bacterium]
MKILVLFFLLFIHLNIFSGTLSVYDNVKLNSEELQLVNSVSREAFIKINNFFYGTKSHSDLKIDLYIETKSVIEKSEGILLSDSILGLAIPAENKIYLVYPFRNIRDYPYNSLPSLIYHEIFHLVLSDYLKTSKIPLWLNEGTAMHLSREFIGEKFLLLSWAVALNRLITLFNLNNSFPENRLTLAYVESHNAVSYLVDNNGETSLQILFEKVRRTGNFEEAFFQTYNKSYLEFSNEWEAHVRKEYNLFTLLIQGNVLWGFFALRLIIFLPIKKYLNKKKLEQWKSDEESGVEIN